jgi:fatty acid desaturase
VGASLTLYRPYHLSHHRHTQQADDPDLSLSAPFPISRASFRRKLVRDILDITGYQRRLAQFKAAAAGAANPWDGLAHSVPGRPCLAVPGPVVAAPAHLESVDQPGGNIAEHAVVGSADDPLRNTRTTYAGPLMRLTVAPYWVNYHLEHHLFVFTPCWKLPRAHRLLTERGLAPRMEIGHNYVEVLRRATSRPTDEGPSGPRQAKPAHL